MVLGIVLTIGVVLLAPKLMKSDEGDGFFRPRANPDAQPVAASESGDDELVTATETQPSEADATTDGDSPDYDFYDLLPGQEVAMTDAQLAAAAREEQARAERERRAAQASTEAEASRPVPLPESPSAPDTATAPSTTATANTAAPTPSASSNDTPYILQAGAFGASGDAEAVKARIALLGLNARVESAQIGGKTVYRVRMGPYGSASELAAAKGKLSSGGLPAMAIKAR